ncbi:Muscle calcium channel subunit alpha-1 [Chlorella sorokiniana]|uniref:Muscle calcium channel subunit alpha-1 n=1 Tax=Chlorella sorokiniana TaxID=3076 RepID=A0A2P6TN99_CHLSO|nr:Muscle calcium channel subunit alpha-1 [Chlorella sorokiniana]|eukprot:PRW50805.1 Muscle calcium channel subunit alpha-1 [Chlorella sorokiniana]
MSTVAASGNSPSKRGCMLVNRDEKDVAAAQQRLQAYLQQQGGIRQAEAAKLAGKLSAKLGAAADQLVPAPLQCFVGRGMRPAKAAAFSRRATPRPAATIGASSSSAWAFDSLPRDALWAVLRHRGLPEGLIAVLQDLHTGTSCSVRMGATLSHSFATTRGTQQGDPLAGLLFVVYMDHVAGHAFQRLSYPVWQRRSIALPTKLRIYGAMVRSVLLYGPAYPLAMGQLAVVQQASEAARAALTTYESQRSWGDHAPLLDTAASLQKACLAADAWLDSYERMQAGRASSAAAAAGSGMSEHERAAAELQAELQAHATAAAGDDGWTAVGRGGRAAGPAAAEADEFEDADLADDNIYGMLEELEAKADKKSSKKRRSSGGKKKKKGGRPGSATAPAGG